MKGLTYRYFTPEGTAFMSRPLDDTDRYLVSFCVAYTGPEHDGCDSPRDAAQAAMELIDDGFPVFVYDRKQKQVHCFDMWVAKNAEYKPAGFVDGWYVVNKEEDDGTEEYYCPDGTTLPVATAFERYERLVRFTNDTDAENYAAALRSCGKSAWAISHFYYPDTPTT